MDYMYKGADGRAVIVDNPAENAGSRGKAGKAPESAEMRGKSRAPGSPKKAVLEYKILQTVTAPSGDELALADIHIHTGRFHQIRAQMANAGMALLGDVKYGETRQKAAPKGWESGGQRFAPAKLPFSIRFRGKGCVLRYVPAQKHFPFFTCYEFLEKHHTKPMNTSFSGDNLETAVSVRIYGRLGMWEKLKENRLVILLLLTGAVYLFLRFIVPLTAPVLIAMLFVTISGRFSRNCRES